MTCRRCERQPAEFGGLCWTCSQTPLVPMNEPREGIGPARPAIIAHRHYCPSCGAEAGEACRLSARFSQEYSHVARHREAQREDWRVLQREIAAGTSPISSLRYV